MITIHSFKLNGINAVPVTIEVDMTPGVGIHLVGLSDNAVKESLLRTVTAMQSLGYNIPGQKIVINLVPADLRKEGTFYDLPIALGILAASGQGLFADLAFDDYVIAGELGLDGSVRDIPGWIQAAEYAAAYGKYCILPTESAKLAAAALQGAATIYGVDNLQEAIDIIRDGAPEWTALDECEDAYEDSLEDYIIHYWDNIVCNGGEKRALEIAAAGGHPLLLVGGQDDGTKLLAHALLEILPPMTHDEAMDVQRIYSSCDRKIAPGYRPFRAPYYGSSLSAMLGGGNGPNTAPGEVSLAHNGVLYLEDFNLCPSALAQGLQIAMEDKSVTISRLNTRSLYAAHFFPVFSAEPCPCGYYDSPKCTCGDSEVYKWRSQFPSPITDKLTMHVWCKNGTYRPGTGGFGEPCSVVAERVAKARKVQMKRQGRLNNDLPAGELIEMIDCRTSKPGGLSQLVDDLLVELKLSVSSYLPIIRIARTIADLDGLDKITPDCVSEAAAYRFFDKKTL